MSQRANKAIIGGFVAGAVVLVFAGVMLFGSGRLFEKTVRYVLYFDGSLKGLTVGAPVVFRGVRIGSVIKVELWGDLTNLSIQIPVTVKLEPDKFVIKQEGPLETPAESIRRMIDHGLRAQLEMQNLVTGQLQVNLDFHPDSPAKMPSIPHEYPEIPTISSPLEKLSHTLKDIPLEELIQKITSAVSGIEKWVNSQDQTDILEAARKSADRIEKLVTKVDNRIDPIMIGIENALADSRKLLSHVDGKIDPVADNINAALEDVRRLLRDADGQVAPLSQEIQKTARAATQTFDQAQKTLTAVQEIVGKNTPAMYRVRTTLEELSAAARSIRLWAEYLERHPEALVRGKR